MSRTGRSGRPVIGALCWLAIAAPGLGAQTVTADTIDFELGPTGQRTRPGETLARYPDLGVVFPNRFEVVRCDPEPTVRTGNCLTAGSGARAVRTQLDGEFRRHPIRISFGSQPTFVTVQVRFDGDGRLDGRQVVVYLNALGADGTMVGSDTIRFVHRFGERGWQTLRVQAAAGSIATVDIGGGATTQALAAAPSSVISNFLLVDDLAFGRSRVAAIAPGAITPEVVTPVAVAAAPPPAASQEKATVLRTEGRRVATLDPQTRELQAVYEADTRITNLRIAATGDMIGFIEGDQAGDPTTPSKLVLLDAAGNRIQEDPSDVRRFTFCCAERTAHVVQVEGPAKEGGVGFTSRGAFITDLQSGQKRPIRLAAPAVAVEWAVFDPDAVYVRTAHPDPASNRRVFRVDVRTGDVRPTPYEDIHFSPSGRYYLHFPDEDDPDVVLYERASSNRISVPESLGVPQGWLAGAPHDLLLVRSAKRPTGETTPSGIRLASYEVVEHLRYSVERGSVIRRHAADAAIFSTPTGLVIEPSVRTDVIRPMRRPPPSGASSRD